MRILHVYDKMPNAYQNYLKVFIEYLKCKMDLSVLVFEKNKSADIQVLSYGMGSYWQFFLYILKLSPFKTIEQKKMNEFDIVHIQYSFLWRKVNFLKNQVTRPKIIMTLRGGDTFVKPWLDKSWTEFYADSDHIDAFVVMSNTQKDYLLRWGVHIDKIHVIPISFGVRNKLLPKMPSKNVIKLVSAFRMTWEKNIGGTLYFAKILKERNIEFEFDFYGDGKDLGQLYYLIDRYGLSSNVFVKGRLDNEELKEQLKKYDFFVQLSYSDALPTSVIEAQSVGLPCVVSEAGGLPEAVMHNKTGFVGNTDNPEVLVDQMIGLWKDVEKYKKFSQFAIEHANNNFSIESEYQKIFDLYRKMIN